MSAPLDYLDRLLVSRLRAIEAGTKTFDAGHALPDSVVPAARLILIREGTVDYRLNNRQWSLKTGDMVLVPSLCRRSWTAGTRRPLTLAWVQYSVEPALEELPTLLLAPSADPSLDAAALDRIGAIHAERPAAHSLEADGEMKALLARFLVRASPAAPVDNSDGAMSAAELAVSDAARWLASHYTNEDAIDEAVRRSGISTKYFRRLFRQRVGMSPHRYLAKLRMHAARFQLHETPDSIKQIAASVGFHSPFHFSRAYRDFWGRSPAQDRRRST